MKIFARFNTEEGHSKLVNTLLKERLLKETIEQLKFFKSKGLTTLEQVEKYIEAQKAKNKTNNYDKHYGPNPGQYLSNSKAGTEALRKWEETSKMIKHREELFGAEPADSLDGAPSPSHSLI